MTSQPEKTDAKKEEKPKEQQCVVIQPGSYTLKIGFASNDSPHCIPHCIAMKIPNETLSKTEKQLLYCASTYNSRLTETDFETIEKYKESELTRIRKELLIKRNIINQDAGDEEVYFEEISIQETKDASTTIQNLPIKDVYIGDEALQVTEGDNPIEGYNLFYPISGGYFNTSPSRTLQNISDILYTIWSYALFDIMKLQSDELKTMNVFLIVQDHFDKAELKQMLNILLKRFMFQKAFVQLECVCSAFGSGMSNVCVIDFGESKTTVAVVEDGLAKRKSMIYLPYGGYNVIQCLLWTLQQCTFPIKDIDIMNCRDRKQLRRLVERNCHLVEGDENFQTVEVEKNGKIYKVEIGDPLYIAPMGYFYPRLFMPLRKKHKSRVEHEDYWTEKYLLETTGSTSIESKPKKQKERSSKKEGLSLLLFLMKSGKDSKKDKKNKESKKEKKSKKKDKKTKKEKKKKVDDTSETKQVESNSKQEHTEANASDKKKKKKSGIFEHKSIDQALISSIKKSGMELDTKKKEGKTVVTCNILMVGGASMIKGLPDAIQARVSKHFEAQYKDSIVKIAVLSNHRDKGADIRFISWKGAAITTRLEAAKDMWITRESYLMNGLKIVREKVPFVWPS